MVPTAGSWRGRIAAGLCVLSGVYSAALLVSIVVIPAADDETLLQYGGPWTVAIFAQPLLVSGLMWHVLRRRCHTGSDRATAVAWTLGCVFFAYSVVGGFTIAAGALPAALLMLLAVAVAPRQPGRTLGRSAVG